MNNFKKIGLSALAGSLVAVSAHAAEFSVSGSASITMDRPTVDNGVATGNDFSMGDSLSFNASGETDGGLGVAVMYEIDGGALDDYDMTLSGDWGSLKFNGSGASSALGAIDDVTPNAYEEAWDIVDYDGTLTVGAPTVIGGGGGTNMFIYTSPSFSGATITAAYQNDGGAAAVAGSYHDFAIAVSPEAVEGLTLGYGAGSVPVAGNEIEKDNSTMYVKYAIGGFTVGYQQSESDHDTTSSSQDSMAYGVTYAVNDDFSIGYSYHEVEFDASASDNTDQESTGISASYTMGGMTLGGAMNEVESMDGVATGDYEGYEFNLSFAF
jgi:outer membrane protein OmpU